MGIGDLQTLRAVDDVVRHAARVREAFVAAGEVTAPLLLGERRAASARVRLLAHAHARHDAQRAEQLLDPVVSGEPGLAGLADAIRAARVVQGMDRPDRLLAARVRDQLGTELDAAGAWRHVHGMDVEARAAFLADARGRRPDELSQEQWRTLAGILVDDVDGELAAGLPRSTGSGLDMRDLALNVANRRGAHATLDSPHAAAHQYFDAWQVSTIDVVQRRARIDELFAGDPRRMLPDQWRELTALLRAGGHDIVEHPWFPGVRVDFATRHAMLGGYDQVRGLAPTWMSASEHQLAVARSQLLQAGDLDELARSMVQRGRLDVVGIDGAQAAAVRLRHLVPDNLNVARDWLVDVRRALEGVETSGPAAELRAAAIEMVDRNLARVDGRRGLRFRDGYANHPDYAELGRVRNTWQLLERLSAPAPTATVPAEAGAVLRW
jgi:hypothetical protein